MNIDIIERIVSEKKPTLPSLRNQDWKTDKDKNWNNKRMINTYLSGKHQEINELVYPGAKLVCDKSHVPLKSMDGNSKPKCEIRLET